MPCHPNPAAYAKAIRDTLAPIAAKLGRHSHVELVSMKHGADAMVVLTIIARWRREAAFAMARRLKALAVSNGGSLITNLSGPEPISALGADQCFILYFPVIKHSAA